MQIQTEFGLYKDIEILCISRLFFTLSVSTMLLLLASFSIDKVLVQSYPFIADTRE
jgi:hypothetical protein